MQLTNQMKEREIEDYEDCLLSHLTNISIHCSQLCRSYKKMNMKSNEHIWLNLQ